MSKGGLRRGDLKARLGKIDAQTKLRGAAKVGDLWRLEKLGMWYKGLEVLREYPELESQLARGGRGVEPVTFRKVAKIAGRHHSTISSWVDLVKHIGKSKMAFDRWVKIAVPEVINRWSKSLPAKADWKNRKV